jgi:hypothetical protein
MTETYAHRKHQRRLAYLAQEKSCLEAVPAGIAHWAVGQIAAEVAAQGHTNADNYRVANLRKAAQLRRFRRHPGCCGVHTWTAVGPDGASYVLAYNYGH